VIGSRAALIVAALALLPQQCEKLMPGAAKAQPDPTPVDPPPPPPPPSITAPPVWRPPDPPAVDAGPGKPETPTDAARARAAVDAKEYKKARGILEKKVKSGKGTTEEAQILLEACAPLKDKACLEVAKKALGSAPE
jgi:hypothetical protein